MKRIIRDILILIVFSITSTFLSIGVDDFFVSTIYTVSGIMFSIGISILVTFNLHGIKKQSFINKIRTNIINVRDTFIYYFAISTIFFIVEKYLRKSSNNIFSIFKNENYSIDINLSVVVSFFLFYSIFYFILNFIEVQKLNDQIFDNTNIK